MKYVIIGNSAGAVGCIEGIRTVDSTGEITLISNEIHHTYSRPLISYLLYGKTDEQRMKYRPDDFYEKNNVNTILGKNVTKIDTSKMCVVLEDGTEVEYGKLMVATGSKPFVPHMEGVEKVKNKFTFMTLDDAHALQNAITPESKVLIVGAGLIGLKCAEGINDKVKSITVVDLASRILPSILDERGSSLVQSHIESQGVKFILSTTVKEFSETSASLTNGETLDFDIVVLAVGVKPNIELVADAGGNVNRGIIVDNSCKTSLGEIYSAGDCTESFDISCDEQRILALLPNAYMQGEVAGVNMAGGEAVYDKAIPMNAIGFFGYHIITAGSYTGEEYLTDDNGNYKKLFYTNNLLKGFILIGDVKRAGIYTKLIREKVALDTLDFDLIKEKPQLMAFSTQERAKQLGGKK